MAKVEAQNKSFSILIGIIVLFGLIILSSAGVVEGQNKFGSAQFYLVHQILFGLLPGLALYLILSRIKYTHWRHFSLAILLGALGLMVLVLVPSLGVVANGAQRWLALGPISFQPSEFLKLGMIIYLSAWLSRKDSKMKDWSYSTAPFFVILGFVGLLLVLQPDMGTLGMILIIALAMYFSAGAKMSQIFMVLLVLSILAAVLIYLQPYQWDRITSFANPGSDIQGKSYHIRQAIISIGSGGIFGVGFGKSTQKINFLPEPVGDSIFAVLVEELGLIGGGALILLFLALMVKIIKIAKRAPDSFSQLFVIGVGVWIIGQAFINIGAISGLIPLTGIPLPLVSYGGTSLVSLLAALGIVNNVARYAK
ncbi:MAG: putative lipid II flippase FtsW [Candidatus Yanofskybacteria bacterium CG10_big_fil_rev_8_21_14_0_10_46_23]|uniref:Probable peptidoglycan glycosyltransferase FtsW n=1 Tax=Candidatus Yanofskybacteria bacterium CG10_big_fil_rev_8_21_14_0_10_46_23 TaxID=1975098 RepID=A0A2H0R5U6_9BACT|nr:MAG: putative lipid II flippase FtsW [Candidatus Yanofskybacteria bacterium CG10_big_fil_rev_8_21_14_0_10_46_23]